MLRRVPEIDGLRALAVLVVVILHGWLALGAEWVPVPLRWGWTAVDLFFVISGYLITTIILSALETPGFFVNFYARRALRIWPIYYIVLIAFVAADLLLRKPFPLDGLAYYLTYTQNVERYWLGRPPNFCKAFAHTWSLAVEEQFYLFWPVLVWWFGRKRVISLCVIAAVTAIGARTVGGMDMQLLLSRADGLALGSLVAALLARHPRAHHPSQLGRLFVLVSLTAGASILAIAVQMALGSEMHSPIRLPVPSDTWKLTVANVFYAAALGVCVVHSGHPALRILRNAHLASIARISYGLYLYHNIILSLAQKALGRPHLPLPAVAAALALSFVVAAASWRWIEAPILALKGRFDYASDTAAPAVAPARPRVLVTADGG